MTDERWEQVEKLYQAAFELEPNERAAFLKEACAGDTELQREVESLLEQAPDSFLSRPVAAAAIAGIVQGSSGSLIGRKLGTYQVEAKIGEGGMGEVYRARDTKLGREVALKVLPPEFAQDGERLARFRREARLLASLNHPNIATIHGLEESGKTHFLVMELVEGQTLSERVAAGEIPLEESLKIGQQIAEALEQAHQHKVVHRDLKPANVKLTSTGRVKVLDFGLAKALAEDGGDSAGAPTLSALPTEIGRVMGTPAYMSPEQAQGNPVDSRADIWAFGCVLYELLASKRAFPGENVQQTIAAVLRSDPDWESLPPATPEQVRELLKGCLQKDPERRTGEITTVLSSLDESIVSPRKRWLTRRQAVALASAGLLALLSLPIGFNLGGVRDRLLGTATPPPIQSLAVLPLENLSGDPEQEYFADGFTDALITDLAKIKALKVISRRSAMQYKHTDKSLPQIARELGVEGIVEGSVMREGQRTRITAQLIRASSDTNLWGEIYERDPQDVLRLQGEVAQAIARQIQVAVSPAEERLLTAGRTVNPEAYDSYLKGMYFINRGTEEDVERGLSYLQQAVEKDPTDPDAYSALAIGYNSVGHVRYPDAFNRARVAESKAEELGEPSAQLYLARGTIKFYSDWDFEGAEADLRRATELNPSLGEAHRTYSWFLNFRGRRAEAISEMIKAEQVDPLSSLFAADLGWQYWLEGRYEEAIKESQKALELNPKDGEAFSVLGLVYAAKGMFEEAIGWGQKGAEANSNSRWYLGLFYALAGQKDQARELAADLAKKPTPLNAFGLTQIYAALGQKDEAFKWLEAVYKARFSFIVWLEIDPHFAPLRDDPRYQDMVRRIGLPQ